MSADRSQRPVAEQRRVGPRRAPAGRPQLDARARSRPARRAEDEDPPDVHRPARQRLPQPRGQRRARAAACAQIVVEELNARGVSAQPERARRARAADRRRHPRLRPARAVPARPVGHRGDGQRVGPALHRAGRQRSRRPTRPSSTTPICCGSSTGSSRRSAGASTRSSPMVDARLPDGSRVNAIIPPLSLGGPSLTIRKFARDALTLEDLIGLGTLERADGRLPRAVRSRASSTSSSRAVREPARRRC